MQKRLEQNKAHLLAAISSIESRPLDMTCTDRTKWILDRLREDDIVPVKAKARGPAGRNGSPIRFPTCAPLSDDSKSAL